MNSTFQIKKDTLVKLIENIQQHFGVTNPQHQKYDIDYLDSFDWSLFKNAQTLTRMTMDDRTELFLSRLTDDHYFAKVTDPGPFSFMHELPECTLKTSMRCASKRALITQLRMKCDARNWNILNNNEKTVARLSMRSYRILKGQTRNTAATIERLLVIPVKGYEKKAEKIVSILMQHNDILTDKAPVLESALAAVGRSTNEYTSKVVLDLQADMDAELALKSILSRLLQVMEMNEDGIIKEIDTEFLHDFRIAVRRTRSIISAIKNVFDPETLSRFKDDFAWLGSITGPARDLDVHLLDFQHYCAMLPDNMCDDITPLRELMIDERCIAYDTLKKAIRSQRYRKLKKDWRTYVQHAPAHDGKDSTSNSILNVANSSIWRSYRHTLKKGSELCAKSPSEAFHDERKECKKLRYLLEFFRKLYPEKELKKLIKALEDIQDQLGKFQDLEVQEHVFHRFADQLMEREDVHSGTLLAMGVLIERLRQERQEVMAEFSEHFDAFSSDNNRQLFRRIFKPAKGTKN